MCRAAGTAGELERQRPSRARMLMSPATMPASRQATAVARVPTTASGADLPFHAFSLIKTGSWYLWFIKIGYKSHLRNPPSRPDTLEKLQGQGRMTPWASAGAPSGQAGPLPGRARPRLTTDNCAASATLFNLSGPRGLAYVLKHNQMHNRFYYTRHCTMSV